jgi:hypothetical protein
VWPRVDSPICGALQACVTTQAVVCRSSIDAPGRGTGWTSGRRRFSPVRQWQRSGRMARISRRQRHAILACLLALAGSRPGAEGRPAQRRHHLDDPEWVLGQRDAFSGRHARQMLQSTARMRAGVADAQAAQQHVLVSTNTSPLADTQKLSPAGHFAGRRRHACARCTVQIPIWLHCRIPQLAYSVIPDMPPWRRCKRCMR